MRFRSILIGCTLLNTLIFGSYWGVDWVRRHHLLETQSRAPAGVESSARAFGDWCETLHRNICFKKGETNDPTGGVQSDLQGELQALRAYEKIIHLHPDWGSEQVDEQLVQQVYTPERRARFEAAFRWVRKKLENFIDRQPESVFTRREKKQLKHRLRKTGLQFPPPASVYSDEPDLFTKGDIYYQRLPNGTMRLRVGGAYLLSVKSWFNLVFTIAHELAHSIDPCEIRHAGLALPAYDRLMACFLQNGAVAIRKTRSECGENDQQSEVFSDWMAVQISAEALALYATEFPISQLRDAASNSVKDLCEEEDGTRELDLGHHPPPKTRIETVFGKHPQIRELLGCSALAEEPEYCDFESKPGSRAREVKGIL